ncbi:rho guanine nucleotide exchange factor 28-like isoform X2 [Lytechinus variegatus]|uniref:rho guanine nucleotide exchange factor 28-like isoform X2 n=1 Tax=Lytechinus variegatus TaxID=7654 RepID=UPI001BB1AC64|nr:rho guanine nucleotide exchange factor 28-like isoform X2 [Lytechinus variegatus]
MGVYWTKSDDLQKDSSRSGEKSHGDIVNGVELDKNQRSSSPTLKECLPPRPQRKKSPSPFPSSSAYPSLRRLALKNRTNAFHIPDMISSQDKGDMSFFPTESPIYGGGQIKISFGPGTHPPDEDAEVFLVFEGLNRRHVTSAKRSAFKSYIGIIPGHDTFEAVSLTVCSLQSGCSTVELRALFNGSFIFVPDSTFYLTQFLISSVWDPDSLDNPARIKGENFNLCEEDFPNLDGRITCAFKHIERPPSWKIVTDSPRIDQSKFYLYLIFLFKHHMESLL